MMTKEEFDACLRTTPVIAILRGLGVEEAEPVCGALAEAGIEAVSDQNDDILQTIDVRRQLHLHVLAVLTLTKRQQLRLETDHLKVQ